MMMLMATTLHMKMTSGSGTLQDLRGPLRKPEGVSAGALSTLRGKKMLRGPLRDPERPTGASAEAGVAYNTGAREVPWNVCNTFAIRL